MSLGDELAGAFPDHFRVLILDNEVTVDAFVAAPPLPWVRLVAGKEHYGIADGYPRVLTADEADREELNWDRVDLEFLVSDLGALDAGIDLVAVGNNTGQGMKLAMAVPEPLRGAHGAIIYGSALPEQPQYETAGYLLFRRRDDLLSLATELAGTRPLALGFINTIQHNEVNYHEPWNGTGTK